jgi:2'-5' RNA ligase
MSRIRTFIAVDLDKVVRQRTIALQETLKESGTEVKWVGPENLHVTLLFLGEVDEREVPEVCRLVAETAGEHPKFTMSVESSGGFPNSLRPRIVWVGVGAGTQELCSIHDDLETAFLNLGFRREDRKYSPHITLGRVKSDRPTESLATALAQQAGWKGGEIQVTELLVMGSKLTPEGPEYTVLSRAKLGKTESGERGQ